MTQKEKPLNQENKKKEKRENSNFKLEKCSVIVVCKFFSFLSFEMGES